VGKGQTLTLTFIRAEEITMSDLQKINSRAGSGTDPEGPVRRNARGPGRKGRGRGANCHSSALMKAAVTGARALPRQNREFSLNLPATGCQRWRGTGPRGTRDLISRKRKG